MFGRGRTVGKTHHSRVGSFTLPVTPPPLSLFLSLGSGVLLLLPLSFPLHRSLHNFTSAPQHSPALSQLSLRHLGPHPPWHNAGIIRDLMEVAIFCRGGITMAMSSIHHCPPPAPSSPSPLPSISSFIRPFFRASLLSPAALTEAPSAACTWRRAGPPVSFTAILDWALEFVCVCMFLTRETPSPPGCCTGRPCALTRRQEQTQVGTHARAQAVFSAHISSSDSLKVYFFVFFLFFFGGVGGEEGKFTNEKNKQKKRC